MQKGRKPVEQEVREKLIRQNIKGLKNQIKKTETEDAYKKYKFHLTRAKMALKRLVKDTQAPHKEPVK